MIQLFFTLCLFAGLNGVENVVIIGGGPAGLTAGIYAGRLNLAPLIIDGLTPAGAQSFVVENYPGFPEGIERFDLMERLREQALRFGAKIDSRMVVSVRLDSRPFEITLKTGKIVLAETLIVACGTQARLLGLESESRLWGKGICTCAFCEGPLYEGKRVVVVGGGDRALEEACLLSKWASEVIVICEDENLTASYRLQEVARQIPNIHFMNNQTLIDIREISQKKVTGVLLKGGSFIPCEGVFLALGYIPNTGLFANQLELDEKGYIKTETETTKTSVPGVFAAGDVASPHISQIILSAASGAKAAIEAYDYLLKRE